MTAPSPFFLGEIRLFAGTFAPAGWVWCDGRLLLVEENDALFNLIGTTYGGDGETTFAVPDLRGRVPINLGAAQSGTTYDIGETGGLERVTLTRDQIPSHNHAFAATTALGTQPNPGGNLLANSQGPQPYIDEATDGSLNPQTIDNAGGGQPHENMQPYLCTGFIMSLFGQFPDEHKLAPRGDPSPFLGEVRAFAFPHTPKGWAPCQGQLLSIQGNTALFSLLGTTYGGNGSTNFALPNLQGRLPLGPGDGQNGLGVYNLGQIGGFNNVTLQQTEMASHNHAVLAQTVDQGDNRIPSPTLHLGATQLYSDATSPGTKLAPATVLQTGDSQPHNNQMPYLVVNYCLAINGIFPSRP